VTYEDIAQHIKSRAEAFRPDLSIDPFAVEAAYEMICNTTGDIFHFEEGQAKLFNGNGEVLLLLSPSLANMTSVEIYSPTTEEWSDWTDRIIWRRTHLRLKEPTTPSLWGSIMEQLTWGKEVSCLCFPRGNSNIRVSGDWGWSDCPRSIILAGAMLTLRLMEGEEAMRGRVKSESLNGEYSITYAQIGSELEMPNSLTSILSRYTLRKVYANRVSSR